MPFVQELSNDYLHRSEFSVIPTAYISTKAQGTAVVVNSSQIKKKQKQITPALRTIMILKFF